MQNQQVTSGNQEEVSRLKAEVTSLQEQVQKLSAENGDLKAAIKPEQLSEDIIDAVNNTAQFDWDSNESGSWTWVENDSEVARAVLDAISAPETPATDEVIRKIGAKAVDKVLKEYSAHAVTAGLSTDDLVKVSEAIQALEHCANQLRAGDVSWAIKRTGFYFLRRWANA